MLPPKTQRDEREGAMRTQERVTFWGFLGERLGCSPSEELGIQFSTFPPVMCWRSALARSSRKPENKGTWCSSYSEAPGAESWEPRRRGWIWRSERKVTLWLLEKLLVVRWQWQIWKSNTEVEVPLINWRLQKREQLRVEYLKFEAPLGY